MILSNILLYFRFYHDRCNFFLLKLSSRVQSFIFFIGIINSSKISFYDSKPIYFSSRWFLTVISFRFASTLPFDYEIWRYENGFSN